MNSVGVQRVCVQRVCVDRPAASTIHPTTSVAGALDPYLQTISSGVPLWACSIERGAVMSSLFRTLLLATLSLCATIAVADEYDDTISLFKKAGESATFFENSYAYAVLPTVGKGGIGVGAAH